MTNAPSRGGRTIDYATNRKKIVMDPHRRVTRSTSNMIRNPGESEGAFWGRMIDPTDIERGQAEAIRAARRAGSDDPSALLNTTQDEQSSQAADNNQRSLMDADVPANLLEDEIPFTSNLTNYTEQSLRMINTMRTAFVDNSPSSTERVTTPVGMDMTGTSGPLDPAFTRPSLQHDADLDAHPTKGPREVGDATNDLLDQYMDENYIDVLRTSLLNPSSYLSLPSVKKSPQQGTRKLMAMDWYVPDGSNRRLVEIPDTTIADFRSPGGGTGAMILTLPALMLHYQTTKYLVDVETGELFGWISNQWRRTGLYCSAQPFVLSELNAMTTRCSAVLHMDLEQEQQTSVIQLSGEVRNKIQLPPLPLMPEPEAYVTQVDVMSPQMRRNYVRDRTQAALTYIKEYETSQEWEQNPQYDVQQVRQRLQIVYGKADQVKQKIDVALLNDDIYRRRRVMRALDLPQRFPLPHTMKDSSVVTWVQWIREESNEIIAAIDDEITRRQDPDDPFDGTASGIFPPLQDIAGTQPTAVLKKKPNPIKIDESASRNPQTTEGVQGRLVDVQSPPPRRIDLSQQNQQKGLTVSQGLGTAQTQASDESQNRLITQARQRETLTTTTSWSTQRRIEESRLEAAPEVTPEAAPDEGQQVEDPFRTLRSFHEKQRLERQGENQPRTSTSSQSTLEGAAGTTSVQNPKTQRITKKHQTQGGQPQEASHHQKTNQPQLNNYYPDSQNNTAYMELPSSIQNKICGKCGLMGHIKRFCKEEVYCKYCRVYTHSTTACRTYPSTSSRKNTPEKRASEEIEQEVNRRAQQEVLRILTVLSTSRQVANSGQEMPQPKQDLAQKEGRVAALNVKPPHQYIPEQRQGIHDGIAEFRRPPETVEPGRMANHSPGRAVGYHNQEPILNQQWGEESHSQPPMRPTTISSSQMVSNVHQTTAITNTTDANVEVPATQRRIEVSTNERLDGINKPANTNEQATATNIATDRRIEQIRCACCNQPGRPTMGEVGSNGSNTGNQRLNLHTEYENVTDGDSKFFQGKRQKVGKNVRECQIIRILPDEDDDYMDLVRDSVSTQSRVGLKPMFVNNYYAGDNNCRTVPRNSVEIQRHSDESRNKASTAVQTAVSFLGEERENPTTFQTGLARVKSMSANETETKVQSPVVVEPAKQGNTTNWSTHSFNIPNIQQDTSRQQCKGFPDFTVPPPTVHTPTPSTTRSDQEESAIL